MISYPFLFPFWFSLHFPFYFPFFLFFPLSLRFSFLISFFLSFLLAFFSFHFSEAPTCIYKYIFWTTPSTAVLCCRMFANDHIYAVCSANRYSFIVLCHDSLVFTIIAYLIHSCRLVMFLLAMQCRIPCKHAHSCWKWVFHGPPSCLSFRKCDLHLHRTWSKPS